MIYHFSYSYPPPLLAGGCVSLTMQPWVLLQLSLVARIICEYDTYWVLSNLHVPSSKFMAKRWVFAYPFWREKWILKEVHPGGSKANVFPLCFKDCPGLCFNFCKRGLWLHLAIECFSLGYYLSMHFSLITLSICCPWPCFMDRAMQQTYQEDRPTLDSNLWASIPFSPKWRGVWA